MRSWGPRRWVAAAGGTLLAVLVLGLPTDLVPNPVFGRQIEAPGWTYAALAVTAVLSGLLLATYVRDAPGVAAGGPEVATTGGAPGVGAEERRSTLGGLLSFLAIGCPTCNKLVVLALGTSGAVTWFEPVQPLLAVGGIALLAVALRRRLVSQVRCAVPAARR